MKVSIIGAGIAGLAMAIGLERAGIEYRVHERTGYLGQEGLGFILRQNGLNALAEIGDGVMEEVVQAGAWLDHFTLRDPDGKVMLEQPLEGALAIRRADLIACLMRHVNPQRVRMRHQSSGFDHDSTGRAVAVRFEDGEREEADLFLACDGSRSRTRAMLFPEAQLEPVHVRELVSIVHNAELAEQLRGHFIKTQQEAGCLSLGLVPCGGDRVIWYMQFDNSFALEHDSSEAERRAFAEKLVGHWPEPIPALLHSSDWQGTHVWRTTDLNALPSLHKDNIVLLGDAGHPLLTFTSQGVNSALDDAHQLCELIMERGLPTNADLDEWSAARLEAIAPMRESGRKLAKQFLEFDPDQAHAVPLAD